MKSDIKTVNKGQNEFDAGELNLITLAQDYADDDMDQGTEGVPDATTSLKFRRLLEIHDLCKRLFPQQYHLEHQDWK